MKLKEPKKDVLNDRQRAAIPFLVSARSFEQARLDAGISKSSLYRWLSLPEFKAELDRQRDAVVAESLERLKGAVVEAVGVLTNLMGSEQENIKLRAAQLILENYTKTKELGEISARLDALEEILSKRGRGSLSCHACG